MAQIGTVRLETQNSGVVDVPVFEPGDSASGIYEFVRVETASGPGFIPVTDPVDATYPYLRVQSQNNGIVAVTDTPGSDIPDKLVDDFEDGDKTAAGSNWSWSYIDNGNVVTSPALAGQYSGEAVDSSGDAGWVAERDQTAQIPAARMLIQISNLTEQIGEWSIGKVTGSPSSGRFSNEDESEFDFISRVRSPQDGSGEIDLLGTSSNIGTISADTTYRILWENIDYSAETYDVTITRVSDDTEIASVTGEPFYDSLADMDFIGFTNAGGSGDTVAVYADDVYVN